VKIGIIAPMSGPFASGGISMRRSLEIARKELLDRGGILGRRIDLIAADSEGNVIGARREALRLILKEKVDFLIGAYLSEETMSIAEIAANFGKILIIPISATEEITGLVSRNPRRYRFIFRTAFSLSRWAEMLGRFIVLRGIKSYAFLGTHIRWNRELHYMLKNYLENKGVTEILSDYYSPKNPVIRPTAFKLARAHQNLVILGDPGGTLADERVMRELAPPFEVYAFTACYRGSSTGATNYFSSFHATYGYEPSGYGDTLPGDALRVLSEAIESAESLETEKIIGFLESHSFKGVAGRYTFSKSHQAGWGPEGELKGIILHWKGTRYEPAGSADE
jgi:branched-chain amino acid transport system substrate-binding protein